MSRSLVALAAYAAVPAAHALQTFNSVQASTMRDEDAIETMSVGQSIGDLCVPQPNSYIPVQSWKFLMTEEETDHMSLQSEENPLPTIIMEEAQVANATKPQVGCQAKVPDGTKLMLMPIVPMYHGSTALEAIYMSSPAITTLCTAKTWQCEARLDFDGEAHCIRDDLLPRYAKYWDMSKPVLFEKGPRGMYDKIIREWPEIDKELKEEGPKLDKLGFGTLKKAYIMMWRPICLSLLSSHARDDLEADPKKFAQDELQWLEDLVASHKYLLDKGEPMMVLNMADLLWKTDYAKNKLETFTPCVGELNFDYVPKMGKDIYEENEWKAEGSVKAFGESVDPWDCCGYSLEENQCMTSDGAPDNAYVFHLLEKDERARAALAIGYLVARS